MKKIFKANKIRKPILLEGSGDSYGDPEFQDPHLVRSALGSVKNKGLPIPPKPMKKRGAKRIVTSSTDAKNLKIKDVRAISSEQMQISKSPKLLILVQKYRDNLQIHHV
ncbi:hypothetical protein FCV25MIE_28783 [Fagus crenata]